MMKTIKNLPPPKDFKPGDRVTLDKQAIKTPGPDNLFEELRYSDRNDWKIVSTTPRAVQLETEPGWFPLYIFQEIE